jgi:20S proteasome subunit beta 4
MGETLIGFVGKGYVMLAADTVAARSIVLFKANEDKMYRLDGNKLLAAMGPTGDRVNFCEYIQANVRLYNLRNSYPLNTKATANYTRLALAEALRRDPYQVNLLLGGVDEKTGPSLYFIDYLATMHPVQKSAHGYGAYFILSTLDRNHRPDMDEEAGKELMRKCFQELKHRLVLQIPAFNVRIIDKDGVRDVEIKLNE